MRLARIGRTLVAVYKFAFVLDQQVGLKTQALNIQRVVGADDTIAPLWVPVDYAASLGLLDRVPKLPQGMAGTLRGVREIRQSLQTQTWQAALWATWAAKSVPELVGRAPAFLVMDMTPTQMEAMGERYGYTRRRARFLATWKRQATDRLYRQATHFYPWNQWVGQSLHQEYNVPQDRITPLSPGVDTALYQPSSTEKLNDGVVRILFVGGDFERKGGDRLLRWAKQAQGRKDAGAWELHLVTRDPVPEAATLLNVIVHNKVGNNSAELVRLYQTSDFFVLPTRADCYSLVAMEALSCGLPVVITALGGIGDIVREGETGYLLPAGTENNANDDLLFHHIDTLLRDAPLRTRMGKVGRADALARFDCTANVGRILAAMKAAA